MSKKNWKLANPKQCKNCPWRVDHDKSEIPGYSKSKHCELKRTIANNESGMFPDQPAMACHEGRESSDRECIGWLVNQATIGNNIGLRLKLTSCENAKEIEVFGKQHQHFADTF
jgi:hypothetical protein